MKNTAFIAILALAVPSAYAVELNRLSAADIAPIAIQLPAPQYLGASKCDHVSATIGDNLHQLAQASKSQLSTIAKTEADYDQFTAMWTPILGKFNLKIIGRSYDARTGFGTLQYLSQDGRVIRSFMAEGMKYDALNPIEIDKLKHELLEPLEKAGMTPVAVLDIRHPAFRPTFNLYYLTKPEENTDHEKQLRQLKPGDDIDFDLLANAVQIVKKDASFSLVYIGRELGFKSKAAAGLEAITKKVEDYKKFLLENKKELIAVKMAALDEPFSVGTTVYTHYANIYFFQ
jgi:ASC-1-like (ASCH) protein